MDEIATVLIRLGNNDRIIGQLIYQSRDIMSIYAPILVEVDSWESNLEYIMSPYDPLSDSVMAIFEHGDVLNVTMPKKQVLDDYEKVWRNFYPTLEAVKSKMLEESKREEEVFNSERLREMFQSFLDESTPIDKSKLN
jgi:hypothetical protein